MKAVSSLDVSVVEIPLIFTLTIVFFFVCRGTSVGACAIGQQAELVLPLK